jgi:hypothetical protein
MCAYVRSFPMVERVYWEDAGGKLGTDVLDALRRAAKPTLHTVITELRGLS